MKSICAVLLVSLGCCLSEEILPLLGNSSTDANATLPIASHLDLTPNNTVASNASVIQTGETTSTAPLSTLSIASSNGSVSSNASEETSTAASVNVTLAANVDANATVAAQNATVSTVASLPTEAANVTAALDTAKNTTIVIAAANVSAAADISTTSAAATTTTTQAAPVVAGSVRPQPNNVPVVVPILPNHDTALLFVAKGTYVKTSAPEKSCKQNPDCYNLREPDEWCPLPDQTKYGDKGCFCDHVRNVCTIQRQTERGEEYSDCAEKSNSVCAGFKPVVRIQQQQAQQARKSGKNKRLRVH